MVDTPTHTHTHAHVFVGRFAQFLMAEAGGRGGDPTTAKNVLIFRQGPVYNLPLFGALGKYVFTREMARGAKQAIF